MDKINHKTCTLCKEQKLYSEFNKRKRSKDGLAFRCRDCAHKLKRDWAIKNKAWAAEYAQKHSVKYRALNKERLAEKKRQYHKDNVDRISAKVLKWQRDNRERVNLKNENWRKSHPGCQNAKNAKRRALRLKATPIWANQEKIKAIYLKAATMKGYEVDHVFPLVHPRMCGLHVEYNLQIISARDNRSKGNKVVEC